MLPFLIGGAIAAVVGKAIYDEFSDSGSSYSPNYKSFNNDRKERVDRHIKTTKELMRDKYGAEITSNYTIRLKSCKKLDEINEKIAVLKNDRKELKNVQMWLDSIV